MTFIGSGRNFGARMGINEHVSELSIVVVVIAKADIVLLVKRYHVH